MPTFFYQFLEDNMSLATPNTIDSNTSSQSASRHSDMDSTRPAGLRIEGLPTNQGFEETSLNVEHIEFCASADADDETLRPLQVQERYSGSMQSISEDGILIHGTWP